MAWGGGKRAVKLVILYLDFNVDKVNQLYVYIAPTRRIVGTNMNPLTATSNRSDIRLLVGFTFLALAYFYVHDPVTLSAFEWVPSEEEIQKYRQSWNPLSEGPLLIQAVDIHPEGQLSVRPFIYGQVAEHSYGNRFTLPTERKPGPVHLYSVSPLVTIAYGLTNHVEIGTALSMSSFWARDSQSFNQGKGGPMTTNTGFGDVSLFVKYRPIIQDPDTSRPSVTLYSQIILPSSRWTGTERPPGGFAPIGRLPSTRFGELGFTEGLTFRKNFRPFRISGGVFYTYAAPGSEGATTTYTGDIVNTRFVFEHFLDDKKSLAYNLEFVGLHTLTWRADGHAINRGQRSGSTTLGIEPVIQWRFGDSNFVGAAGVLFTVAGQNALDAIYPNFSIQWYWRKTGRVIMR